MKRKKNSENLDKRKQSILQSGQAFYAGDILNGKGGSAMFTQTSADEAIAQTLMECSAYLDGMDAICKRTAVLPHEIRINLSRSKERADQMLDDLWQHKTQNLTFSDIEGIGETAQKCALAHWGAGATPENNALHTEHSVAGSQMKEPILAAADSIIYNLEIAKANSRKLEGDRFVSPPEPADTLDKIKNGHGDPVVWGDALNDEFVKAMSATLGDLKAEGERVKTVEERKHLTVTTLSPGPIEPIVLAIAVDSLAKQNILPSEGIRSQLVDCSNLNADFRKKLAGFWSSETGVQSEELLKAVDWFARAGNDEAFGGTYAERRDTISEIVNVAWQKQSESLGAKNHKNEILRMQKLGGAQAEASGAFSGSDDPNTSCGPSPG